MNRIDHPDFPKPELDNFETELLNQLRDVATERSEELAVTGRRRRRWARGGLVAAAAVTALAVPLGMNLGGAPVAEAAFTLETQDDGDIVIRIHELTDSEGLEAALAEHGIDADVTYGRAQGGSAEGNVSEEETPEEYAPGDTKWTKVAPKRNIGKHGKAARDEAVSDPFPRAEACGWDDPDGPGPISLERDADDYVVTIPVDSVIRETSVDLWTWADEDDPSATQLQSEWLGLDGDRCLFGEVIIGGGGR